MHPVDTEHDDAPPPASTGIDRSIGYLAIGLIAALFFCLTIFGMTRMERRSTDAMNSTVRPQVDRTPTSEIVGAGTESPR
jgi:hypothetical protein